MTLPQTELLKIDNLRSPSTAISSCILFSYILHSPWGKKTYEGNLEGSAATEVL